ncbi:N-acetylmuramoyl-L-alanine amidase [Metabacillus sediminilitoris]|uniref:N-acetylmuramoyl-L-alanine amidase n=1 Tax=Metabacillus sediminilitoris TaxID=2567941 RepID=UPI0022287C12|nr:N-acetylmuramoyl-L-alanine amidase [Metabacillus sediminilitoris]
MKKILFLLMLCMLLFTSITVPHSEASANSKKICIDLGHQKKWDSGKEPIAPRSNTLKTKVSSGTAGTVTKIPEYEFTLNIGLKLEKEMENRGYSVYITRTAHDIA